MKVHLCVAAVMTAISALTSCSTMQQFSYLEGKRYFRAPTDTYDATVISVDGKHYLYQRPVMIEPGLRKIVVQAPPAAGFRQGEQRAIELNVEPCKRYWFAAVKKTPLSQDFEPRVDHVEDVAGCGVTKK